MFSNRGDVLDRMCDSIFVPDGCCGNSCFNPREGFEQLLMSALIFWAVEVDIDNTAVEVDIDNTVTPLLFF